MFWSDGRKSESVTFHAVATPGAIDEFQAAPYSNSLLRYMHALREVIINHPVVAAFWDGVISTTSPCIDIIAKEINPSWTIEITLNTSVTAITSNITDTITPDTTPENYIVCVDVFFQEFDKYGGYQRVATLEDTPDSKGLTTFNLGDILDSELHEAIGELELPGLGFTQAYIADTNRQYFIRISEKWGAPIETQDYIYQDPLIVRCGGIDQKIWLESDHISSIDHRNSLLSWMPAFKEVHTTQQEQIAWYNYKDDSILPSLKISLFDGTSGAPASSFKITGVKVDSLQTIVFPVGYQQLGLATQSIDVKKYCVQVIDSTDDSILSPIRCYTVDCTPRDCLKYILYFNGFCMPETMRLTGQIKKDLTVDRFFSETIQAGQRQWCYDWDNVWTFRSGYLPQKEVDALQELVIYNNGHTIEEDGYCAILIDTKKFSITQCLQFLHTLEFTAVRSQKAEKRYSTTDSAIIISECCCENAIEFADGNVIEFDSILQFD